jgi:NAD(P)-dependent dehydrogenase (short-subunit alcohol dehydrogenase family)
MKLTSKTAVVVGGSQGLGRALATALIVKGVNVVIVSRNRERLEATAREIGALPVVADVRNEQSLRDAAAEAIKQFGAVDLWVNSAGVFKKFPPAEILDLNRAHELFDVNFFGAVLGSRTALLNMHEGVLINILSSAALDATRAVGAELYAASKWAVRGYIDALRAENAANPVKIFSVYPGGIKTHLHDEALPTDFDHFMDPAYVVEKIIANLEQSHPDPDLIIKRPSVL